MARLITNGLLDWKRTFDLSGNYDAENGVALQSNGKILLTGLANSQTPGSQNMALVRLNPDGSSDPFFGSRHSN